MHLLLVIIGLHPLVAVLSVAKYSLSSSPVAVMNTVAVTPTSQAYLRNKLSEWA